MITPSAPITDALLAVATWKHQQLTEAQRCILEAGLRKDIFGPEDVADTAVKPENRQGCVSNGYNGLVAAEIIEKMPLSFNDEERGVFGGRIKSGKKGAKGRWTAAYRIKSRSLAEAWLVRHGFQVNRPAVARQEDMAL